MEGCKLTMKFDRLDELRKMYQALLQDAHVLEVPDKENYEILVAHAEAMCHRLRLMAVKEQANYKLTLSKVEAIAMRNVWKYYPYAFPQWSAEIVRDGIAKIDQWLASQPSKLMGRKSKLIEQAKAMQHGTHN